ncbi:MAG: ribonuclease III [Fibrobacterota bacterium]
MIARLFKRLFGRNVQKAPEAPSSLETRIQYRFRDRELLALALSHRSYALSGKNDILASNERFEFLGDALLGFVVGEFLFLRYPDQQEGELSRLKSLLISRKALKEAADRIGLSEHLLLSKSEEKTGGRTRFSINTNAFEALIAAVFLDGGFAPAKRFIEQYVLVLLDTLLSGEDFFNYKSKLLELVQAQGEESPRYSVLKEAGPDHDKTFEITVGFWGKIHGTGTGKTKKEAEQAAARAAVEALEKKEG